MIVVAIIGILAAIAIPAYQDYTVRAQVTEGLNLASDLKAAVGETFANDGTWPADNLALGITAAKTGKYVTDVSVANGTITITFGNQANVDAIGGQTLALRPMVSANGDVIWVCGNRTPPDGAADPATAADAGNTTVLDKYLPTTCRTGG
jgi:type IV pilus assembly protein PilA